MKPSPCGTHASRARLFLPVSAHLSCLAASRHSVLAGTQRSLRRSDQSWDCRNVCPERPVVEDFGSGALHHYQDFPQPFEVAEPSLFGTRTRNPIAGLVCKAYWSTLSSAGDSMFLSATSTPFAVLDYSAREPSARFLLLSLRS